MTSLDLFLDSRRTISDVALVIPGTSPRGSDINDRGDGLPFYQGAKEFGTRHPRPERFTTRPVKTAKAGDILLSVRAPVGRVNIADTDCAIGRGVMAVRPKDPADVDYLAALLGSLGDSWDAHASDGTMFANLSKTGLEAMEINWPESRHRVAEVLQAVSDGVESCTAVATTVDEYFHGVWLATFGQLQLDGEGSLRDFCRAQYGVSASGSAERVGPRLLRVTDINKTNWVDWRNVPFCKVTDTEFKKYQLESGDCVVARMADPGKTAMVEVAEAAVFASYLIRIKPKTPIANHFLFGYLKSRYFTDYTDAASSGSVQQNINAQTILDAPCALPDAEELASFEVMAKELRAPLVQAIVERNSLIDLQDFLLPRLLSGELRVSEAEKQLEEAL